MSATIFDVQEQVIRFENTKDLKKKLDYMDKRSIVPSFRRTRDPIALAFEHIDNKPLNQLAEEFVKETFMDAICFISKVFE